MMNTNSIQRLLASIAAGAVLLTALRAHAIMLRMTMLALLGVGVYRLSLPRPVA
jgi:hypothetical protein